MDTNRFSPRAAFVNPDTNRYFPGFDARHVSVLLAELKEVGAESGHAKRINDQDAIEALGQLQTGALRAKLTRAVEKFNGAVISQDAFDEFPTLNDDLRATKDENHGVAPRTQEEVQAAVEHPAAQLVIREEELPDTKVGRWFYPTRRFTLEDGTQQVQRNAKRDGSSDEWLAV
jgi:hypothetical protein